MKELEIHTSAILFLILFLILLFIPILIQLHVLKKRKIKEKENTEEFFKKVSASISAKSINTLNDVLDIHESIFEDGLIGLKALNRIQLQLKKFKTKLLSSNVGRLYQEDNKGAVAKVNSLLKDCQSQIDKELAKKPFEEVPEPERHHLEALDELTKTYSVSLIHKYLIDLAESIKLRDAESKKYIDEQKESLSLARKGLFSTVGFSVISIALAIYFYVNTP
ncbi:hypothetical protein SAMN02745753_02208 [Marinomonas polaris DSM 16579]|uniref:Uncharacterized protein n=1 Tax=Marinomonas polaris DSM 16579 TaxID=1122206 RepID=A0A1M5CPV5_9GAMM|nr:hypothetical protein [Marinomonas polaris]SHF56741.1 hypothetical protein SAMN02745753_02208 [Marinomonas polaris DSM 16579]